MTEIIDIIRNPYSFGISAIWLHRPYITNQKIILFKNNTEIGPNQTRTKPKESVKIQKIFPKEFIVELPTLWKSCIIQKSEPNSDSYAWADCTPSRSFAFEISWKIFRNLISNNPNETLKLMKVHELRRRP